MKQRDQNIQKAFRKEIDMSTRTIHPKKLYSRKEKHKGCIYE